MRTPSEEVEIMLLRAICALVLLGILVAGLWPFHTPRNEVSWLSRGNGIFFGKHGSIVSAGMFQLNPSPGNGACSLEIWLEPSRIAASGTILAFYRPEGSAPEFALRQSLGDLTLQRISEESHRRRNTKIFIDDVFSQQKPVLVTISSDGLGTTIYADGVPVKNSSNFRFSSDDLTGQFIVGNSPVTTDTWSGRVMELAIFNRELSAQEVSERYTNLISGTQRSLSGSDGAVALYLFNERNGNAVHDHLDSAPDLLIPKRFFVLREPFLELPWNEFYPKWSYWKNVGINLAGFIPLGLFFCAYVSSARIVKRPVGVTIVLGFVVSLTIEVLQAFLPTRNSGMTDLFTNTLGTALGAILYVQVAKHNWFVRTALRSRAMESRRASSVG